MRSYSFIAFSCICRPLSEVVELMPAVLSRRTPYTFRDGALDLRSVCWPEPPAGVMHATRAVLFAPSIRPDVTVLFSNWEDGWMTLGYVISRKLACRVYQFEVSKAGVEWAKNSFTVIDAGEQTRHVHAMQDDPRWVFCEIGSVLPQEQPLLYRARSVRDRLDREHVIALATRMGLPLGDDRFWQSDLPARYIEAPEPKGGTSVSVRVRGRPSDESGPDQP